jgi:hypothetical protein
MLAVKETKELLVGVNELSLIMIKHLKDGAQISDVMAIVDEMKNNPELLAKLEAAKNDIAAIPEEIKDCSLVEAGELAMVQISYVPKIIAALK